MLLVIVVYHSQTALLWLHHHYTLPGRRENLWLISTMKYKYHVIIEILCNAAISGTIGTAGTSGTPGTGGTSGTAGTSGTPGTIGTPCTGGTSGTPGISGTAGTSGTAEWYIKVYSLIVQTWYFRICSQFI